MDNRDPLRNVLKEEARTWAVVGAVVVVWGVFQWAF